MLFWIFSGAKEDLEVSSFVMSCFLMLDGKPVTKLSTPALLNFKTSVSNLPNLMIRLQIFSLSRRKLYSVWSLSLSFTYMANGKRQADSS